MGEDLEIGASTGGREPAFDLSSSAEDPDSLTLSIDIQPFFFPRMDELLGLERRECVSMVVGGDGGRLDGEVDVEIRVCRMARVGGAVSERVSEAKPMLEKPSNMAAMSEVKLSEAGPS